METKQKTQELNNWIEENKEMVDLVIQDFQRFQKKLYGEMYKKVSKKYPLYWKNSVEKIREKLKILSKVPGDYLDYEICNFLQSCLNDYADTCEEMQGKEKGKCGRCEKELEDKDQTLCDECDDEMSKEEGSVY